MVYVRAIAFRLASYLEEYASAVALAGALHAAMLQLAHNAALCGIQIANSSVLISSDGTARLISCFPSAQALRVLLDSEYVGLCLPCAFRDERHHQSTLLLTTSLSLSRSTASALSVLASNDIPRCVLNRQIEPPSLAQDIRSVAYVMAEMLTGTCMRGHLLQPERLERHVTSCSSASSAQLQVLTQLLLVSSLNELLPPLNTDESKVYSARGYPRDSPPPSSRSREQRAIARLIEHELTACREQRRRALHNIRTWATQFEKRHSRKPSASDRSASITRLQRRCRALADRIAALETRLDAARASFDRTANEDAADSDDREQEQQLAGGSGRDATPVPLAHEERDDSSNSSTFGSLLAIDVSVRSSTDRSDTQRRSPAQHAFLQRLSPAIEPTTSDAEVRSLSGASDHVLSDRTAGHRIIHHRKDVMAVIHTIATSTSTSPVASPHLL